MREPSTSIYLQLWGLIYQRDCDRCETAVVTSIVVREDGQ